MPIATFGAGCFWGVEEEFSQLDNVTETKVGYMGGTQENPKYQDVCFRNTGHTEVCQVRYHGSYKKLLDLFFKIHDAKRKTKEQYMSVIFYHDEQQKKTAEEYVKSLGKGIVTEIKKEEKFWPAENYHQEYYKKHKLVKLCSNLF